MPEVETNTPAATEARIPLDVARRVRESINNCEISIDHAYVATAEYAMLVPTVRGQARLAFGAPQDAISRASEALALLAQARDAIRTSHKELDKLARHGGLDPRVVAEFPWEKPRPPGG